MALARVSVVRYLNTVPLIWGMLRGRQQGKYELSLSTPAGCADDVREGKADVGIIPSIEYQRIDEVEIIDGFSIASKTRVRSVLLLSKLPVEDVRRVAVDRSSRTSVALLRILMESFYTKRVTFAAQAPEPVHMLEQADAALVIGDHALTYDGGVPWVYDLAAEWRKFTGLPFVFALWVGHRDAKLTRFRKDFEESRDYGLTRVDDIAAEYASRLDMTPEAVKTYLTENIDYSLDEENLKGLRFFYKLAREAGIIAAEKDLHFA